MRLVAVETVPRYQLDLEAHETTRMRSMGLLPPGGFPRVSLSLTADEIERVAEALGFGRDEAREMINELTRAQELAAAKQVNTAETCPTCTRLRERILDLSYEAGQAEGLRAGLHFLHREIEQFEHVVSSRDAFIQALGARVAGLEARANERSARIARLESALRVACADILAAASGTPIDVEPSVTRIAVALDLTGKG